LRRLPEARSLYPAEVETVEKHGKGSRIDEDGILTLRYSRSLESSFFEAFIEKDESTSRPSKDLDAVISL